MSLRVPGADTVDERWQQITGVFHAALLRDSAERQPFLEDACADDEGHLGAGLSLANGRTRVHGTHADVPLSRNVSPAEGTNSHE
jgi:hypothetical protein